MKKTIFKSMAFLFMALAVMACGKDDEPKDANANAGADNFDDVAVTGSCTNIRATTATLNGYINIDKAPIIEGTSSYDMGVCYTDIEDADEEDFTYVKTNVLQGRAISVNITNLKPDTKYYYHTFFRTSLNGSQKLFIGETLSFTTTDFENSADVECIATSANGSALLQFNIDEETYREYNDKGYEWGVSFSPYEEDLKNGYANSYYYTGNNLMAIGNLTDQEYYYCAYTKIGNEKKYGKIKKFKTETNNPYLEDFSVTDITLNSAVVNFSAKSPVTGSRFDYGVALTTNEEEAKNISSNTTLYYASSDKNPIKVELNRLEIGTTYYYIPYFRLGSVYFFSEYKKFSTVSGSEYVKSLKADVEVNFVGGEYEGLTFCVWSGTFYGSTTIDKLFPNDENTCGFEISDSKKPGSSHYGFDLYTSHIEDGKFSVSVNEIDGYLGTLYWRAFAIVDNEKIYGEWQSFILR